MAFESGLDLNSLKPGETATPAQMYQRNAATLPKQIVPTVYILITLLVPVLQQIQNMTMSTFTITINGNVHFMQYSSLIRQSLF